MQLFIWYAPLIVLPRPLFLFSIAPAIERSLDGVVNNRQKLCRAGDESAGALFVLMGTLQNSTHPQVLPGEILL